MMLLDYDKLWNEAGYGKDNPWPRSLAYIEKTAKKEELHRDVTEALIGEFFLELKMGKRYPLDKCPCGCGIDKSGTAATHALAMRVMKAGDEMREFRGYLVANAVNERILQHIEQDNEEYTRRHLVEEPKKSLETFLGSGTVVLGVLFLALFAILFLGGPWLK